MFYWSLGAVIRNQSYLYHNSYITNPIYIIKIFIEFSFELGVTV